MDVKVSHARRPRQFLRGDGNFNSSLCQVSRPEKLSGVESSAGAERGQKKFRRCHACVCSAILAGWSQTMVCDRVWIANRTPSI